MEKWKLGLVGVGIALVSSSLSVAAFSFANSRVANPRFAKGGFLSKGDFTLVPADPTVLANAGNANAVSTRRVGIPVWCGAPATSLEGRREVRPQFTCVGLDDSIANFTTVPPRTTLRIHTVRLAPFGTPIGPAHLRFSLGSRSLGFLHTARSKGEVYRQPEIYTNHPEFTLTSVTPLMILGQNEALTGSLAIVTPPGSTIAQPRGGTARVGDEWGELSHEFSVWGELSEDP